MIRGHIEIIGSPEGMIESFGKYVKEGLTSLISIWHGNTAPRHFTTEARTKWKYQARTPAYQRYKDRKRLGPLVFSGESRRRILRSIKIEATPKKASGSFDASRYFWMQPPHHPDKGGELTALTGAEIQAMAQGLNDSVTKNLNDQKDRQMKYFYG